MFKSWRRKTSREGEIKLQGKCNNVIIMMTAEHGVGLCGGRQER